MPHGIALEEIQGIKEILTNFPETRDSFQYIFKDGHLAKTTIQSYNWIVRDFISFCKANVCPYPLFNSETILRYLANSVIRERTFSFYRKVSPALKSLEKTLGLNSTSINQTIITALSCLKRLRAQVKPPVKKARAFNRTHLKTMIDCIIINPTKEGDFVILTDQMLEDCGDYIKISLPRSKQDQYYAGTCSYISVYEDNGYCPVQLIRLYFKLTKLTFNYQGLNQRFLCCRFRKKQGVYRPILSSTICYSTAVKHTRNLLTKIGLDGHLYTETSLKAGGVSEFLDTGMSLADAMLHGRWKNEQTVIYYRRDSPNHRLSLCRKL